jgi:hypothetical protein
VQIAAKKALESVENIDQWMFMLSGARAPDLLKSAVNIQFNFF